jgi:hypothetical protein
LLIHRTGPTSFADLRTVNGFTHSSFKEAAIACGIMDDDKEWDNVFTEFATFITNAENMRK